MRASLCYELASPSFSGGRGSNGSGTLAFTRAPAPSRSYQSSRRPPCTIARSEKRGKKQEGFGLQDDLLDFVLGEHVNWES